MGKAAEIINTSLETTEGSARLQKINEEKEKAEGVDPTVLNNRAFDDLTDTQTRTSFMFCNLVPIVAQIHSYLLLYCLKSGRCPNSEVMSDMPTSLFCHWWRAVGKRHRTVAIRAGSLTWEQPGQYAQHVY